MYTNSIWLFAVLSLSATTVHAVDLSRFSGEFSLNTGVSSTNSNLDVNGPDTLTKLDKGSKTNNAFIAPLGNLSYSLNDKATSGFILVPLVMI